MEKLNIWRTEYLALVPKKMIDSVKENHPKKDISVHFNTDFLLSDLREKESVCYGDGKSFVFILKKQ